MLLAKIANIPYIIGIVVTVVTVTVYMSFSGYMGISECTDTRLDYAHWRASLIAPIALGRIGGMGEVLSRLTQIDPEAVRDSRYLVLGKFFSLSLVWGLICWGQPQLITRFYAVKDSRTLGITMVVVCLFTVLTSTADII